MTSSRERLLLDAFIIERIRQQRRQHESTTRIPLRIEVPPEFERPRTPERAEPKEDSERGVAIIDFTI
jgi:hypothetical protein